MADQQGTGGNGQIAGLDVVIQAPGVNQTQNEVVGSFRAMSDAAKSNASAVDANRAAYQRWREESTVAAQRAEALKAAGVSLEQVMGRLGATTQESASAMYNARTVALQHAKALELLGNRYEDNRAIVLQHIQALEMNAKAAHANASGFDSLVASLNHTHPQLGMVERGLATVTGHAIGLNGPMERLSTVFLQLGVGGQVGFAVVAGLAAITALYEKLTEASHKAAEEQEKLTKTLEDWYEVQQRGVAGERLRQLEAESAKVKELTERYEKLSALQGNRTSAASLGMNDDALGAAVIAGRAEATRAALAKATGALKDGQEDVNRAIAKAISERETQYVNDLAHLVRYRAATADEQAKVTFLVKDFQAQLAGPAKHASADMRNQLIEWIHTLQDAEKSTLGDTAREEAQVLAQRLAAYNHMSTEAARTYKEEADKAVKEVEQTLTNDLAFRTQQYNEQTKAAERAYKDETDAATRAVDEQIKQQQRVEKEFQAMQQHVKDAFEKDMLSAVERFANGGLKSFETFFREAERLAIRFIDQLDAAEQKMYENGTAAEIDAFERMRSVAKVGGAALSGGLAGYQIGHSSGNSAIGAVGGGLAGFELGNAILPGLGGAVGALAGAAGGLLGASSAQSEAAEKLRAAADALSKTVDNYAAGAVGGVAKQMSDVEMQFEGIIDALMKMRASGGYDNATYTEKTRVANDAFASYEAQIRDKFFGSITEQLNALRGPAGAYLNQLDAIEKAYKQNIADAKAAGASDEQLAQVEELRAKSLEALKKAEADASARIDEDLKIRQLYAQGLVAEGEALKRQQQERAEIDAAMKAGWTDAQMAALKLTQALEDQAAASAKAEAAARRDEDLQVRALRARGLGGQADLAAFDHQQRDEMAQAIKDGMSDSQREWLAYVQGLERSNFIQQQETAKQTGILNAQLGTLEEQLNTAKSQLAETQRVLASLSSYAKGLVLNPSLTTLSPGGQVAEGRSQLNDLYSAAINGDKNAAAKFPDLANTFLQASRTYNASGMGYVQDFASVQQMLHSLTDRYGEQQSFEQQMLAKLQEQIDILKAQLAALTTVQTVVETFFVGHTPGSTWGGDNNAPTGGDWTAAGQSGGSGGSTGGSSTGPAGYILHDPYLGNSITLASGQDKFTDTFGNVWVGPPPGTWTSTDDPNIIDVRGYASGGYHRGGPRIVGERGPELELTGPSHITSNDALTRLLTNAGDDSKTQKRHEEQLRELVASNRQRSAGTQMMLDKLDTIAHRVAALEKSQGLAADGARVRQQGTPDLA